MKILHLTQGFPPERVGGVELHTRELAREMAVRGHEVEVLCATEDPGLPFFEIHRPGRESEAGVRVARVRVRRSGIRFESVYRNRPLERAVERYVGEIRPDVVHVQSVIRLSAGILEGLARRGVPTVMTLHDYFTVCPLGQRIRRDLDLCVALDRERCARCLRPRFSDALRRASPAAAPLALARTLAERAIKAPSAAQLLRHDVWMRERLTGVDLLVTPSRFHRERFVEYGIPPERIRVVENGLPPMPREPRVPDPEGRVRFAYVGLLLPTKGVHVAVEAFDRIARDDVALDVHGCEVPYFGDTGYVERLRALVRTSNPVRFHGRFEGNALPAILARTDVLLVPSVWWETFGLTTREAFQAGVPVLASRIGGLAEAFEEGRGGLFFEPGDVPGLAATMERVAGDADLRRRLAATVPPVRSVEDCARELVELYREVAR